METEKAIARDWSSLLLEVLNVIAKGLREVSDFVRFRAVCKAWRSSTPITDLPPQFPWIIESNSRLSFYSISTERTYNIHTPNHVGQLIDEKTEGYLLYELSDQSKQTNQPFILNPLNNHKISLPACDNYNPIWLHQRQNQIGEHGICCELVCQYFTYKLVLCRLGQDQWSELKLGYNDFSYEHYYLKGMLFSLERNTGFTKVVDITNGTPSYVIPPIEGYSRDESIFSILEASGDILATIQYFNEQEDLFYEVHRLDAIKIGFPCWVKVNDIGNNALFMDNFGGLMLQADDMVGIKANCIYYFEHKYVTALREYMYEMVRMDIKTGTKERRVCQRTFRERVG